MLPPSAQLWAAGRPHAQLALFHPFVAGLAAGSLPADAFRAFLLQDAYYLTGFAKAYAFALTKVQDARHVMVLIEMLRGIEEELARNHASFLEKDGTDVFAIQEDSLAEATKNYVGFLLDTASRPDASAAEILTAMTPCARLYAFLGTKIHEAQEAVRKVNGGELKSNPFQLWIDSYASEGFQAAADKMEMLLDELATAENSDINVLATLYNRAMDLELCFFEEFYGFHHADAARDNARSVVSQIPAGSMVLHRCADDLMTIENLSTLGAQAMTILSIVGAESLQGNHSAALEPRIQGDELAAGRFDFTGFVKASIKGNVGTESVDGIIPMMISQSSHGGHRLPLLSTFLITSASASNCPTNITYETTESAEAVAFVKALVPHRDFQWYADSHQAMVAAVGGSSSLEIPPRVLIIAGSDSGGGAGIQADMKACTNLKAFSSTAITAVTVQNTLGVHGIFEIPTDVVRDQIACVMSDIGADVIKTGVLSNEEIIKAVSESIRAWNVPVVVDPVMVATSGDLLLQDAALHELVQSLFPLATIVTPNIPEASALLGSRPISSVEEIKAAAKELAKFGPAYVLVKGGHLPGDRVHDVLYARANDEFFIFSNEKLETNNTHGTGCTLASAIAAKLAAAQAASGNSGTTIDVVAAVKSAIEYLHGILKKSQGLAIGTGNSRPMFHAN